HSPATPGISTLSLHDALPIFERSAAWSFTQFNLAPGGETQLVDGLWASGSFFDTLGVPAVLGRTFSDLDDRPGAGPDGPVAVIRDRKSTRLNSSHLGISYAVF